MTYEIKIPKNEKNRNKTKTRKCKDCSNIIDYKPRIVRCPDCYKKHTNYSNNSNVMFVKEDD
jgi:Zn finger protein HypA/HybF involved in hydrogenase expression